MKILIKKSIEAEARKRLGKREAHIANKRRDRDRFIKRTGETSPSISKEIPDIWKISKYYDPVWCLKNSNILASGIYRSFISDKYYSFPSARISIKKNSGGSREIDLFSIPDTALASLVYRNLVGRNQKIFSYNSYAFRTDKNVLDAVHYLRNHLKQPKIFVIDFDFKNFFASIRHNYLELVIDQKNLFKLTQHERFYIRGIIRHTWRHKDLYQSPVDSRREIGIPQGISISLFLANVAAHELDRKLESANGVFARYSDDSVVITCADRVMT